MPSHVAIAPAIDEWDALGENFEVGAPKCELPTCNSVLLDGHWSGNKVEALQVEFRIVREKIRLVPLRRVLFCETDS